METTDQKNYSPPDLHEIFRNTNPIEKFDDTTNQVLSAISERVPCMIAVYDTRNGSYLYVNGAVTKILGYTPSEFISGGVVFVASLMHPDDVPAVMRKNDGAMKLANDPDQAKQIDESFVHFEYRMMHKDGTWRWLQTHGSVFDRDASGKVSHVLNVSVDITDRVKAEEKSILLQRQLEETVAKQNEEILTNREITTNIIENISEAVFTTDLDFVIQTWNQAAQSMYGYPKDEVIGKRLFEIIKIEQQEKTHSQIINELLASSNWIGESVHSDKFGKKLNVLVSKSLIRDLNGEPSGIMSINADITEKKAAQAALEANEQKFRALIENSTDGIVLLDETARITYASPTINKILGYEISEFVGRNGFELMHKDDVERVFAVFLSLLKLGPEEVVQAKYRYLHKNGSWRWLEAYGRNLLGDNGVNAIVANYHDITETKIAEDALRLSERRFEMFMENLPGLAWIKDSEGRYIYANDAAEKAFQMPKSNLYGRTDAELFSSDTADQFQLNDKSVLKNNQGIQVIESLEQNDGLHHSVVSKFPIFGSDGNAAMVGGVAIDISERMNAERALHASLQRYSSLVDAMSSVVWVTDSQGAIVTPQPSWEKYTGQTWDEYRDQGWLSVVHADDQAAVSKKWAKALLEKQPYQATGRIWHAQTQTYRYFEAKAVPIKEEGNVEEGNILEWVGIISDIHDKTIAEEQRRQAQVKMEYTFLHDSLTDLPNRLLFNQRLNDAVANLKPSELMSVMIIDLDRFKMVNESLGHSLGDLLLQEVGLRLANCLEEKDTLARLGGDEFGILLTNIGREEEVGKTSQKILESLKHPFRLDEHELYVTPSIGISLYPLDGRDPSTLMRNADTALYRAKEQGRNNFQFYTPTMNAKAFERLSLENMLRKALKNNEFVVYYQPQLDLESGRIVQVESLLRWMHPDLGLTFPDEFIDLAETTGLIEEIGEWVLYTTLNQMNQWHKLGYTWLRSAVNMSARQFKQKHLVRMIHRLLREANYDPAFLEIELTENAILENLQNVRNILAELKRDGVKFAMDDFNTGYSSLKYIKSLPIDVLKIDRWGIKNIPIKEKDTAIVNSIINLAHSLKMTCVAEGVDREEQVHFLKQQKCDMVQGYLFSPAVEPNQITSFLEREQVWQTKIH